MQLSVHSYETKIAFYYYGMGNVEQKMKASCHSLGLSHARQMRFSLNTCNFVIIIRKPPLTVSTRCSGLPLWANVKPNASSTMIHFLHLLLIVCTNFSELAIKLGIAAHT